jgi:hypothetical protein
VPSSSSRPGPSPPRPRASPSRALRGHEKGAPRPKTVGTRRAPRGRRLLRQPRDTLQQTPGPTIGGSASEPEARPHHSFARLRLAGRAFGACALAEPARGCRCRCCSSWRWSRPDRCPGSPPRAAVARASAARPATAATDPARAASRTGRRNVRGAGTILEPAVTGSVTGARRPAPSPARRPRPIDGRAGPRLRAR